MKLDRLLGILAVLLKNGRVTAPALAEKFEVCRRTIGRDIDALCRAGIPVVTRQGSGGGISIAEGFRLDGSVLTRDEMSGIIAALKGIGSVSEAPLLKRTLEKLYAESGGAASFFEPVVIDLASHYKDSLTEKIGLIQRAVRERRLLEFVYYYEKGQSHRRVEPYFVVFQWTSWYLFGFCRDREDFRLFKLGRLWDLRPCEESYVPREVPEEKRDFGAHLQDDKKLVALFHPSVRHLLIEAYGPLCCTETEDGLLRLEIGYTNRDYIISWLLGFGGSARVLEPYDIAEAVRAAGEAIANSYK